MCSPLTSVMAQHSKMSDDVDVVRHLFFRQPAHIPQLLITFASWFGLTEYAK